MFAAAAGIEIAREFCEEAISGKSEWDARPAWMEMMQALSTDGITTILIEGLDRLARDLMVQEHIIADLQRRGITLLSTKEPDLCTDDPSRKLLRQIMGAIAEYDRAMITIKLRGARQRMKVKTGRCEGRKPYGYDDPEEKRALAMMFELRDAGLSYEVITHKLNEMQIPTKEGGKQWYPGGVSRIFRRINAGGARKVSTEQQQLPVNTEPVNAEPVNAGMETMNMNMETKTEVQTTAEAVPETVPAEVLQAAEVLQPASQPEADSQPEVLSTGNWGEMISAMTSGRRCAITEDVYDYFLDVLPPVYMGQRVTLPGGAVVRADFGFAEGANPVTAFWREKSAGGTQWFCQQTDYINPYA